METALVMATPFKNVRRLSQPWALVFKCEPLIGNLREWPPSVLGGVNHLLHFHLLHIQRELMSNASLRVIELDRGLIKLKMAIAGVGLSPVAESLHLRR